MYCNKVIIMIVMMMTIILKLAMSVENRATGDSYLMTALPYSQASPFERTVSRSDLDLALRS